jgi:soluble lytic murein transglycosylase-like protein
MKAAIQSIVAVISLGGCTVHTIYHSKSFHSASVRINRLHDAILSWPSPAGVRALRGAVLIRDGPPGAAPEAAIARAILHANPRIAAAYALLFAGATVVAARAHSLPPEFLGATLLQESAYDPEALSSAGAIGIAQFMPETAAGVGLDPYDPFASIAAAAALLGGYADAYRARYADAYATALAAYNAGPLAVAEYRGVPPYAETREYVALIFDRWARIVSYELPPLGALHDKSANRKKTLQ